MGSITEQTLLKRALERGWDGDYADDPMGQKLKEREASRMFEGFNEHDIINAAPAGNEQASYSEKLKHYCYPGRRISKSRSTATP